MNSFDLTQIVVFLFALLILAYPLGNYMALVYTGALCLPGSFLKRSEEAVFRFCKIDGEEKMGWQTYAVTMLIFNALGMFFVYAVQRLQASLPLNPQALPAVAPDLAFNTAVSFATNTNWQNYGGETTLSYLTQLLALTGQNFLSAAAGMACLVALIRAFVSKGASEGKSLGNFWQDLYRSVVYILLPLSLVLSLFLVSQGCPQTFSKYADYKPYEISRSNKVSEASADKIALGPVASQVAIKQLGTNGGGFFNTNSSHPLENPSPLSNLAEMLSILLIPAALCQTFGKMVGQRRQGFVLALAMTFMFVVGIAVCYGAEAAAPYFMEGKEVRFGLVNSVLWAVSTTAASNGSVNAMHDSFSPLGGLVPMFMIQLGEIVYGGVGSGLYGMIVFALITVFIAGLMVGRTPEYLQKKVEAFEIKMCSLVILFPPLVVLLGAALAVSVGPGQAAVFNTGPHAFSEILYAFSSAGNNNGSAFGGLSGNSQFYNYALGVAMFIARYWLAVPILALAGSLSGKKQVPQSSGTMPTDTLLFVALLIGVIIIFGGLTFVPALALGPIVEHLKNIF